MVPAAVEQEEGSSQRAGRGAADAAASRANSALSLRSGREMRELPRETRHERGIRGCSAGIERCSRSRCSSGKHSAARRGRRSDRRGMRRAAIAQFFVETTVYLDLTAEKTPEDKAHGLREHPLVSVSQEPQLRNPDHRIMAEVASSHELLGKFVIAPQGIKTGDDEKWLHYFWEVPAPGKGWEFCQSAVSVTNPFGGRNLVVDWRTKGEGMVRPRKDNLARRKRGVAISQMSRVGSQPVRWRSL